MTSGRYTARQVAELYLAAHRGDRSGRPGAAIRDRDESRRAERSRTRSTRSGRAKGPRGPLHGIPVLIKDNIDTARPDDDDRRLAGARGLDRAAGRLRRRAAARGRRRDPRQDEPERVGELPLDAFDERLERARRPGQEPLRARSQPVRLELRHRRGDRRQPRGRRRRHRNRRLDRLSVRRSTGSSASSRRSASSAAAASSRSRTRRTPPARWRAPSPMRRCCSAAMVGVDPRDAATQAAAARAPATTTRSRCDAGALKGARIGVARKRYFGYSAAADRLVDTGDRRHEGRRARSSSIRRTSRRRQQLDDCENGGAAVRVQGGPQRVSAACAGRHPVALARRSSSRSTSARRRARCRTSARSCSCRRRRRGR